MRALKSALSASLMHFPVTYGKIRRMSRKEEVVLKMRAYISYFLMASCFFLVSQEARAEKLKGLGIINLPGSMEIMPELDKKNQPVRKGNRGTNAIRVDTSLFTEEPFFKKIKFVKLEPAMSLSERVDRLLYGIYTDIPPEYDHFGYEIRRYMAAVGSVEAYKNEKTVEAQLRNLKNTRIILEYWQKSLEEEIDDIERVIAEKKDTSNIRTRFKYNRGVVKAFMIETRGWINANEKILEYVLDLGEGRFQVDEKRKILSFKSEEEVKHYAKLYKKKLEALAEFRGYMPFRMMIY